MVETCRQVVPESALRSRRYVVQFWMLLVASVIQGVAFGFFGPTRVSFTSEIVGRDQLGNAIIDGVRYVAARPHLRRLVLSSFVIIMFGFNYVAFIPALVKGELGLGDGSVGLIMSASSIGAVLVALPIAGRADGAGVWRLMVVSGIVSGIVFGAGVIALGLSPVFLVAMAVVVLVGAGTTGYQSLSNTIALNMTDDTHQGRVQSLMMLSFVGFGIAAAPLGLLAETIGLRQAIVVMGVVTLVTMLAYAARERHVQVLIERGTKDDPVAGDLGSIVR